MATLRRLLFLAIILPTASAHPAIAQTTRHASADFWLDRAVPRIEQSVGAPDPIILLDVREMAICLVWMRGNEGDRALLRRLANVAPPERPAAAQAPDITELSKVLAEARVASALGDRETALKSLEQAKSIAITTDVLFEGMGEFNKLVTIACVYVELGDMDRAVAIVPDSNSPLGKPFALSTMAEFAAFARQPEMRENLIGLAMVEARKEEEGSQRDMLTVARVHAWAGDFDRAAALLREVKNPYYRNEFLIDIGRIALRKGNRDAGISLLREAIDVVAQIKPQYYQAIAYNRLIRAAAEDFGDKESFLQVTKLFEPVVDSDFYAWTRYAFASGVFQEREKFETGIRHALAQMKQFEDPQSRADSELLVAAAYAAAGNRAEAVRWLEQSKKTLLHDDYSVSDYFSDFCWGTVLSGDVKQAFADAEAMFKDPKDISYLAKNAALRACARGEFAQAWEYGLRVTNYPHVRVSVLGHIAQRQAAAGQTDTVLAQIATLTPHESAAILLLISQDRLGIQAAGNLLVFLKSL